jgi:L-aminopeptidase/D-esterase-like protein
MSPLFKATVEATEEAVINALGNTPIFSRGLK